MRNTGPGLQGSLEFSKDPWMPTPPPSHPLHLLTGAWYSRTCPTHSSQRPFSKTLASKAALGFLVVKWGDRNRCLTGIVGTGKCAGVFYLPLLSLERFLHPLPSSLVQPVGTPSRKSEAGREWRSPCHCSRGDPSNGCVTLGSSNCWSHACPFRPGGLELSCTASHGAHHPLQFLGTPIHAFVNCPCPRHFLPCQNFDADKKN